jgi:hypothetical protein
MIPGCEKTAVHGLGVRLRRPGGKAIFSPETGTHLCDNHAQGGLKLTISVTPTDTGEIETEVIPTGGSPKKRKTPIRHRP